MKSRSRWVGALLLGALVLLASRGAGARGVNIWGRPLHLHIPPSYTGAERVPLVILLHGVGVTATFQEIYMRIGEQADLHNFIYAYPDGLRAPVIGQFWNGAKCCQPPFTFPVDDVGYIDAIIDHVRRTYALDERRIFIIGHSNGAFMASRYACERPQVAAIVTLGGGQYKNIHECGMLFPLPWVPPPGAGTTAVLHIHATADAISPYWVGWGPLPSAWETVASWAWRNGCFASVATTPIDLDPSVAGTETSRTLYDCVGPALEFWTMTDSVHAPNFAQSPPSATFGAVAVEWLLRHGRR